MTTRRGGLRSRGVLVAVPLLGVLAAGAALAVGAGGVTFQQFTSVNLGVDNDPAWSRDGANVYWISRAQGLPYAYVKPAGAPMAQAGTRLTSWTIDELAVTISGDNQWAMLAARDSLSSTHLWRCPSNGSVSPLTQVTYGPYDDLHPDWWGSGASQVVAFASSRGGDFRILTLVPNGTLPGTQLQAVTGPGYQDFHPSWSPDGQAIAFSSNRSGTRQIFIVRRQGGGWGAPEQVTTGGSDKNHPAWSPAGGWIAYQTTVSGNRSSDTSLWICKTDGSSAQEVTGTGDYDAEAAWSPDGDRLAFVSDRGSGGNYIWLALDVTTPARTQSWGRIKDLYRR